MQDGVFLEKYLVLLSGLLLQKALPAAVNKAETWLTMFVSTSTIVLYDG